MTILPPALAALIDELQRLPGIGRKTATRLALHVMRRPASEARSLARSLAGLHEAIRLCSVCFSFSENDPCQLCSDPRRDAGMICVVEGPADMMTVEKTGVFKGLYHLLHGVLAPMDGIGPEELRVDLLIERVRRVGAREVLIATSSTVPGEATASCLLERLLPEKVTVSRLACGIPMGMDIKYADEMTLSRAIERRQVSR